MCDAAKTVQAASLDPAPIPPQAAAVADPRAIMARASGENFPVALRFLPKRYRAHLLAIYGFARLADELGDAAPGSRDAGLDWLSDQLDRAFAGRAEHPLLIPLAQTIAACGLAREPFARLIAANRQDQRVSSYASWEDLRAYCDLSANPVGELVLDVFALKSPERLASSDSVCTALQLIEHLQDVREDLAAGRVYLPGEDLDRFDCPVDALRAPRVGEPLRAVLAFEAARAAALLDSGGPALLATVRGWPRVVIAGFIGGGRAALDALARADYEVLALTPRPSRRRVAGAIVRALDRSAR
jgi:squalene synthase HpnC